MSIAKYWFEVVSLKPTIQLLKYIATAVELERDGLKFYKAALKKLPDPNSKGLLKFLVKEEEYHLKFFTDLKKNMSKDKKLVMPKKIKNPLFKKKDYKKISGRRAQTIDVFTSALEMEERGIRFYKKMAKDAKDKSLKKFLLALAEMEKKHFKLIKQHQDAVYDAWYWEAMDMPALNT